MIDRSPRTLDAAADPAEAAVASVLSNLARLTQEGKVGWEETATPGCFIAAVRGVRSFRVQDVAADAESLESPEFDLRDAGRFSLTAYDEHARQFLHTVGGVGSAVGDLYEAVVEGTVNRQQEVLETVRILERL